MTTTLADLWQRPSLTTLKAFVITTADASGLPVSTWVTGDPSERIVEIFARVVDNFLGAIVTKIAQSYFLDQATDPGDEGDDSPDQTPRAGWLSTLGEGTFGTVRGGETFATGTVTLTNDSGSTIYLRPGDLVFERNFAEDDGGVPTYTTTADDDIYVNSDGSVTVANGASVDLPIQADIIGTYSNASAGTIDAVQTGSFGSLSVTNAAPVLASDREARDLYIANCKRAPNRVATGSPTALIEYAAFKNADGTPLQRHDDTGDVGTNRIFVDDGVTVAGRVTAYLADPDGGADAVDVASAHANITGIPEGIITDPIAVVHGVVDYDTEAAAETTINVVGSVKIKAKDLGSVATSVVKAAIVEALEDYFSTFPITGLDQVATSHGFIYRNDLEAVVRAAYPNLYAVDITTPATASEQIPWGEVAVLDSEAADWTVTTT